MRDMFWSVLSVIFVGFWLSVHTGSVFIAAASMFNIIMSLAVSIFIYRIIFGIDHFTAFHGSAIYLALGIGADDTFVLVDAWKQARRAAEKIVWRRMKNIMLHEQIQRNLEDHRAGHAQENKEILSTTAGDTSGQSGEESRKLGESSSSAKESSSSSPTNTPESKKTAEANPNGVPTTPMPGAVESAPEKEERAPSAIAVKPVNGGVVAGGVAGVNGKEDNALLRYFLEQDRVSQSEALALMGEEEREIYEKDVQYERLLRAYTRTYRTIFNTSFTTAIAFCATIASPLMPVASFGIFASLCILVNYVFTITIGPAILIIHERKFKQKKNCWDILCTDHDGESQSEVEEPVNRRGRNAAAMNSQNSQKNGQKGVQKGEVREGTNGTNGASRIQKEGGHRAAANASSETTDPSFGGASDLESSDSSCQPPKKKKKRPLLDLCFIAFYAFLTSVEFGKKNKGKKEEGKEAAGGAKGSGSGGSTTKVAPISGSGEEAGESGSDKGSKGSKGSSGKGSKGSSLSSYARKHIPVDCLPIPLLLLLITACFGGWAMYKGFLLEPPAERIDLMFGDNHMLANTQESLQEDFLKVSMFELSN